jgi:non-heme chloroperoxidase
MTTRHEVRAADGVLLAVEAAGPSQGRPLVFLHGIAQSRAVWRSVLTGPLAAVHRLVAIDMRGHGDSSAPVGSEAYATGERLGGDLHAVIGGLALERPIVVAWSYGGVVLGEYLRRYGAASLGGVLCVAAAVKVGKPARALFGPVMMDHARALLSEDPAVYEAGARAFLGACPAQPLGAAFLDEGLREMLRVPAHVRRALLTRSEDYSAELAACTAPVGTVHGTLDRVVLPQMSDELAAMHPGMPHVRLEGVGHLPWLEAAPPFGAAVRAFVERAGGR